MNVAIIGAGNMSSAFARCLAAAGHHITLTARNLDQAKDAAEKPERVSTRFHQIGLTKPDFSGPAVGPTTLAAEKTAKGLPGHGGQGLQEI